MSSSSCWRAGTVSGSRSRADEEVQLCDEMNYLIPVFPFCLPIRYTAVASYTGTATSKYATGYTVTADYKGDVTRTSCDTVIYTAVFSSVGAAASAKSGVDFNWLWLLIPVGAAALGGCGYAGYKGYKHYINKKRGYAA